jgi:CHAD domain-containing protein/HD superfamily phosphodiesterase
MGRVPEEAQRAGSDLAPEPVHDLRVALRRCRSMADGLGTIDPDPSWKSMKKAGKALFASLGELRDVQVMTEWVRKLGPADDPETTGLLDLLSHREHAQKAVASHALQNFDVRQWRKWSRELPRRAARVKRGSIVFKHLALERWTTAYDLHRRALRNRSQVAWHELRIGVKRFRYIVENFLPQQHALWSDDLKELQDLLGDVHDLDVLWATATQVNAFETEESRSRWQGIIREAREKRITRYQEKAVGPASLWRVWRKELPEGDQVQSAALARLKLWASFLDPDFAHSQRVAALAVQLFDGLTKLSLVAPETEPDPRTVLLAAALMHDVGRSRREKDHHRVSYRLIRKLTPPLGWTALQLQLAAVVARFHRGALPRSRHKLLRELAPLEKRLAVGLAGVLRFAHAFDGGRDGQVQSLQLEQKNGALVVSAAGYSPWTSGAEDISAARHLLEVVLRKPILVKPMKAAPVRGAQKRVVSRSKPSG